ncbi:MAG TPA: hypothetical protein VMM77_07990 [Gemmatimonadaceae bacterium]|nr:hypothetical protein [Gemmatimonadaceae bacterium]
MKLRSSGVPVPVNLSRYADEIVAEHCQAVSIAVCAAGSGKFSTETGNMTRDSRGAADQRETRGAADQRETVGE